MKTYEGVRDADGCFVIVHEDGTQRDLAPRFDLWNHSPTGFEWGYAGSGPAQLALAILADVLNDDERAVRLHQRFKAKMIQSIDAPEWKMTEEQIREAIRAIAD